MTRKKCRAQAIDDVADALKGLADAAAARNVTLCMETHDDWCDPQHVKAVLERVDHPHVAVNWDIMHPVRQGLATMEEAFAALEPWIRHVHFHDGVQADGKLTLVPVGEGSINHAAAIRLLKGMGYDGYLSGEWIKWQPFEEHLPRELATMKRYEDQAG